MRTINNENVTCWGCKHFTPSYDGDYSLEGYIPPENMACNLPELEEAQEVSEPIAIVLETLLFQLSILNNCPFKEAQQS